MMYTEVPTINEIMLNKPEKRNPNLVSFRPTRYKVGQHVVFKFGNLIRRGRITTEICHNGVCSYHIETASHTWYRGIDQEQIIGENRGG